MRNNSHVIVVAGVDLGATQTRVALADVDGRIVASARKETATFGSPGEFVDWVVASTDQNPHGRVRSLAIGVPGLIDSSRGVVLNLPNVPRWHNFPVAEMIGRAIGCPVHLENDANLAGLAEFHQGAGRGCRNMTYITWSSGIGGALILDGELYSGGHGFAGEIGHIIADPRGPACSCGQQGCLEAVSGGVSLGRQTGKAAVEVFQAAEKGDNESLVIVRNAATHMGRALITLTNLFDPEVVVFGGGITGSWHLLAPVLTDALAASPFIKTDRRPELRVARLGDSAGEIGAVELARSRFSAVP